MMLVGAILSALLLLIVITVVLRRALHYLALHPELMKTSIPLSYIHCQRMLARVIERYHQLENSDLSQTSVSWRSQGGYQYVINHRGIEQTRGDAYHYYLTWLDVGGVGMRMQPGFRFMDRNRDGYVDSRTTTGYAFYLLIVPLHGRTISIQIPTEDNNPAGVDFSAVVLAFANQRKKRINVFGFSKPPAPRHQRVSRY